MKVEYATTGYSSEQLRGMQVRGRVYCLAADAYFLMNPLRIYL